MDISNHDHHAATAAVKIARAARDSRAPQRSFRWRETVMLLAASLMVGWGLWIVYGTKTKGVGEFDRLIDLNRLTSAAQLYPVLGFTRNTDERDFIARKIYSMRGKHLPNAGAVAGIRVTRRNWLRNPEWEISVFV